MGFIGNKTNGKLVLHQLEGGGSGSLKENLAYVGGNILDSATTIEIGGISNINKQAVIDDVANFLAGINGLTTSTFVKGTVTYEADIMTGTAPS